MTKKNILELSGNRVIMIAVAALAAILIIMNAGAFVFGSGLLSNPQGVAVDGSQNIIVADTNNNLIRIFSSTGTLMKSFGGPGAADGNFTFPGDVALNSTGHIFVADSGNNRIQVFNSTGVFQDNFGVPGNGQRQFNQPSGVAVNSTGVMIIADSGNNRIQIIAPPDNFLLEFGSFGTLDGEFNNPVGVAVNSTDHIFVADTLNNRIQVFNPTGGFLFKFGTAGAGDGNFDLPGDVAVIGTDIIVADTGNNRIQVFDMNGNFVNGIGAGQLFSPAGVAVNGTGSIIVADSGNNRMQVFEPGVPGSQGNITGKVKRTNGTGIQGATVTAGTVTATTNASGDYSIMNIASGTYTVTASIGGFFSNSTPVTVTTGGNHIVDFTLVQPGSIRGTVTNASSGLPIELAAVTLESTNDIVTTDASGIYTLTNVLPGLQAVTVSDVIGFVASTSNITVLEGVQVTLNFPLTQAGNIAGVVMHAPGIPIEGAMVNLGAIMDVRAPHNITDANGNYLLTNVAPGPQAVTASADGFVANTSNIVVTVGVTTPLDFVLTSAGSISGKVTDASSGAGVHLATVSAGGVTTQTDPAGNYALANVAPGTISVTASKAGSYFANTLSVPVTAGNTSTLNIPLQPMPGSITGRVTNNATGAGIAGASVSAG
ncbi:MAG TPA: carboxypeptidase regulatory-like domain-containing protein, partial [candidate division Zixibacteria bacterium]|nr:carboxypeptidase regulatory-like domain-containing protein [candidate division Zixibacteria bacterium]